MLAFLAVVTAAPSASAQSPLRGNYHTDTPFAYIALQEAHPASAGEPVPVRFEIVFKPGSGVDGARRVMFAFNLDQGEWMRAKFTSLTYADGTPVEIEDDRRDGSTDQPKVFVNPANASLEGRHVIMSGTVTPLNNGRLHIGGMAMAFTADWQEMKMADGLPMFVYGFGELRAYGLDAGTFAPPFVGQGNIVPAEAVAFAYAAAAFGMGYVAWRRGALEKVADGRWREL